MIIQPANYDTTADYLTALDEYFVGEGEVYINKLDYDINRECERVDYFINILGYQTKSDFADYEPTPGFDDYTPPAAQFNIYYYDGSLTTYQNTTATYTAGDTVTFEVIGSDSNVNIVYYEIEITISTAFNTAITQVATVTDNDNDADYSIVIPNDWIGDATVTSVIANTRQEPIYYALSESPYSAGTMTQAAAPGVSGSLNDRVIGDVDFDGLLTVADLLTVTGRNYDFRLRAFHHISIVPTNSTYDPISGNQNFLFTIHPATEDYTWQTGSGNAVLTGQKKDLTDLQIAVSYFEGNTPMGQTTYNPTASQLNSDGSLSKTLVLTADGDPVNVFFMVTRALNDASLPYPSAGQATSNQFIVTFGPGYGNDDHQDTFEPGNTQSFRVWANANLGVIPAAICWSRTGIDSLQSRYKLQGYATSDYSGDPVVSQEFLVSEPANPSTSINLMHVKSITLPATHDRDLYWKPVWSFLRYSNLVFLEQLSDSPIDLANIGNLSVSDPYYDPSDAQQQMSVTFTPDAGVTASDYEITLTAVDTSATGNPNVYSFAIGADMSSGPWSWSRSNFPNGNGLDRIKINFSISLA